MKKLFILAVICFITLKSEAQFNYQFTDESIPVTGVQYGVVGGGITTQLFNRDDVNAISIKPETINFNYFAGAERIRWYTPHFGIGQQVLLWNGGAAYSGALDTTDNAPTMEAKTRLQYIKIPALFYWKSYNRWHPDRRLRVNTFFGPYIAMLGSAQEDWRVNITGSDDYFDYSLKSGTYIGIDKDSNQFFNGNADETEPFKLIDYGFVMGAGAEMRLWRRTVVALTFRLDIGMAEVENKDFEVNAPDGTRYRFYQDVIGKFQPYTSALGPDFDYNRPETRNVGFGAQLSIRKYFGAK